MLSIFDIFKIGLGPSSSHTNAPMLACYTFLQNNLAHLADITRVQVDLYGSLSLTGKGHHTDKAIIYGLLGYPPYAVQPELICDVFQDVLDKHQLLLNKTKLINFFIDKDVVFHKHSLELHENGMQISCFQGDKLINSQVYYSTGGGFISTKEELANNIKVRESIQDSLAPYPFSSADEYLLQAEQSELNLAEIALADERTIYSTAEITAKITNIWQIMQDCIEKGISTTGILNEELQVVRRAPEIYNQIKDTVDDDLIALDWINLYAIAVAEQNASLGRIITSPTNGSSGVIPAILAYYNKFVAELTTEQLCNFFAVAGSIGQLYKRNASVAGAEVGCQGEIGVSASMAAAGLCFLLGGTNEQILNAAEIAMEHFLGTTCDPIGGLVLIPCIERNAMGAVKALNSARLALKRQSKARIKLDNVIKTMYVTGRDINAKYKETSLGGLAVYYSSVC